MIEENEPDSDEWTIEFLTPAECAEVVDREAAKYGGWFNAPWAADVAEKALIHAHRPPFNTHSNPQRAEIPDHYARKRLAARAASRPPGCHAG
jgi:hypothetical protein